MAAIEVAAGIAWPVVQQYALIENALGAAEGRSPATHRARDRRAVGALQRGGTHQPGRRLSGPAQRGRDRPAGTGQPAPGLPLQPLALEPMDGGPGVRAARLLGRTGRRGGRPARPLALPPRRAALLERGHPDGAASSPRLARHGRPRARRRGAPGPAPARDRAGRALLLLPGGRARPAARARPRSGRRRPR